MLKRVLGCGLAAGLAGVVWAAPLAGSCPSAAIELRMATGVQSTPVALTQAYNEETGTYDATNYVCYYKATLTRSRAYSVWLLEPGANVSPDPASIDFYSIDPKPAPEDSEDVFEPGAMFEEHTGKWKPGRMQVMTEDEWWIDDEDPEMSDPPSWVYIFQISGEKGAAAELRYCLGNALPKGIEDNPVPFNPAPDQTERVTPAVRFVDGEFVYHYSAEFVSGRRYLFAVEGGTGANPYSLAFGADGKVTPYAPWASDYNISYSFDPSTDGEGNVVTGEAETNETATFRLRYRMLPARTIAEHDPKPLVIGAEGVAIEPGRLNATDNAYYDLIVDDNLFSFSTEKGARYVAETVGATTNLLMCVYDSKGKLLYKSDRKGDGTGDVRCGFVAGSVGPYYVGVCQKLDDDDLDPLADTPVRLTVEKVVTTPGSPDVWDDADDSADGATMLAPVRGNKWAIPSELDEAGTDWHRLDKNDWYDVYKLPVRAGLGYSVNVSFESVSETPLTCQIFTRSGKVETFVSSAFGDINPSEDSGLFFEPKANGIYYLRIRSSGVLGLSCPRYRVHTIAYHAEELNSDHVGLLHVDAKGCPEATWTLGREAAKYPLGTTIALPIATNRSEVTFAVNFETKTGFSVSPKTTNVKIVGDDEPSEAFAVYSDTFDPKDDRPSGVSVVGGRSVTHAATSLTLKNSEASWSRTLWDGDPADTFAFAGKDGQYYDLWLDQSLAADAVFSITNAELGVLCSGTNRVHQLPLPTTKAKYILTVAHADPAAPRDTSYALGGFFANVGQIKFSAAEYKAKENAAEVKLTVNRTAKDGKVRVRLTTVDGENATGIRLGVQVTDDPKIKFYHVDTVLEWPDGDNKAKDVVVKLIPDRVPTLHDFARFFTVRLEDAFDGADDCYHASFAVDAKTKLPLSETKVTLQETAKKAPGTIQVADRRQDVKKPVFDVRAGETLNVELVRVDGADAAITVKVDTAAVTGVKGSFQTLVWEQGETAAKAVSVPATAAVGAKTFVKAALKLTATSKDKPKFAASSITVNVYNGEFRETLADYAKAQPKTCGYTVKEGKSGTWVVADDGGFVNASGSSALTFTVTGPARFSCRLDGVATNVDVTAVGKTQTVVIPAGVKEVSDVEYDFNFGDYATVCQAVKYGYDAPIAAAGTAKVGAGKLPDGVKLEQDKATKAWWVRGVPTKPGFYYAEIQDASVRPAVALTNLAFEVVALRSAVGTYNGLLELSSVNCTNGLQSFGSVQLTVAATGKLSAKVALAGKTFTFAATGFDSAGEPTPEGRRELSATLTQIQKASVNVGGRLQSVPFTNELVVTLCDRDESDESGWRMREDLTLTMAALPDLKGSGFRSDVGYVGCAHRDNSKVAAWVTAAAQYAGYYTLALVPRNYGADAGAPTGNGYLTLTLDAKGKAKVAGALADGKSVSASSVANFTTVEGDDAISIPLFTFKSPALFGGFLTLRFATDGIASAVVAAKSGSFVWISQDAAASLSGSGFLMGLMPSGGYYDTVENLQRAYLNYRFEADFPEGESLDALTDILRANYGDSYGFVAAANPCGEAVSVVSDTVSAEKQVLAKSGKLVDFATSVNPGNVKLAFKRATGVVTGTCDLWYEGVKSGAAAQGALKGLKHAGVLVMNRQDDGVLAADVWTAGAVQLPQSWKEGGVTRKWNASMPFNIRAVELPQP